MNLPQITHARNTLPRYDDSREQWLTPRPEEEPDDSNAGCIQLCYIDDSDLADDLDTSAVGGN